MKTLLKKLGDPGRLFYSPAVWLLTAEAVYFILSLLLIRSRTFPARDTVFYLEMIQKTSEQIRSGEGLSDFSYSFPFFPLLLAGLVSMGIPILWACHGFVLLCGGGLIAVLFRLADVLYKDKVAGFCAAFLAATLPFYLKLSAEVLRDIPFYLCFGAGMLMLVRAWDTMLARYFAGTAIFGCLGLITRMEGVEFLATWIIMIVCGSFKFKERRCVWIISNICAVLLFLLLFTGIILLQRLIIGKDVYAAFHFNQLWIILRSFAKNFGRMI